MRYADPVAFRTALEVRLRASARQRGVSIDRLRKQAAFDRLLARLLTVAPDRYVLKGGYALDVRLGDRARATQDIDLAFAGSLASAVDDIDAVAELDVGDYFAFAVARTSALDNLDAATAARFRVDALLAGRRFERFNLDIGYGSGERHASEMVDGHDVLAFADLPRLRIPTVAIERHIAEKVHAYTRVYREDRPSTRVKDLVDLVLVGALMNVRADLLADALRVVFSARAGHGVPAALPEPPTDWPARYRALAEEVGVDPGLQAGWRAAAGFLNPVLGGGVPVEAVWSPGDRRWVAK